MEEQLEYVDAFVDEYFDLFDTLAEYPLSGSVILGRFRKAPKPSGKDRGAVVVYELDDGKNVFIVSITSFL